MHGVYKYEANGEVIYVGKTDSNFEARFACHKRESSFAPYLSSAKIFVCEMKDAREADFMETLLISQHKPKLNKSKKSVTDCEVYAVLDWALWSPVAHKKKRSEKRSCTLYLSDDNMKKLSAAAKKAGLSKSEFIDHLLSELL